MQNGNAGRYMYGGWWSVWWTGTYSMVLSKAAFFHKKYLSLYTNQMPASIREYVAKNRFFLRHSSLNMFSLLVSILLYLAVFLLTVK